jgi:magnesium-protoporphyrin O-methyltransferase
MNELSELRYLQQRDRIETYFDRTAAQTWARLTSTAPVSGIRATVRAGRDQMRQTLLDWLPRDLTGKRVLDAGCGTGALSVELAKRGAQVLAIDLSPTLVALARERAVGQHRQGTIDFRAGDMFDPLPAARGRTNLEWLCGALPSVHFIYISAEEFISLCDDDCG